MPQTGLFVNPAAGGARASNRRTAGQFAAATGARVFGWETTSREEWSALVRARAAEFEVVVFGGGDGTLADGLNALPDLAAVRVGCLPLGTGNAAASAFNLPGWRAAAAAVARDAPLKLDLLKLRLGDATRLALLAGTGFDARVCAARARSGKRGVAGYVGPFLSDLLFTPSHELQTVKALVVDGREVFRGPALAVAVLKHGWYGARLCLVADARADDGLLHAVVFTGGIPAAALRCAGYYLGLWRDLKLLRFSGRTAVLREEGPTPYFQCDGEVLTLPAGARELKVEVLPGAVRFLGGA